MDEGPGGPAPASESAVRGLVTAVLFLAFFGALWALLGLGGLKGLDSAWLTLAALIPGIALLVGGIALRSASTKSEAEGPPPADKPGPSRARRFGLVFGIEAGSIMVAYVVCRAATRVDLFFPAMMLIVGLHFLPLATLFDVPRYYGTGVLLCGLAIVTMLVVPQRLTLDGTRIAGWSVALCLGGALILWAVGLLQWNDGRKLIDTQAHRPASARPLPSSRAGHATSSG